MAVYRVASFEIDPEHRAEALSATQEVIRYNHEHMHGTHELLTRLDGEVLNKIFLVSRYASLAEFEDSVRQRAEDTHFPEVIERFKATVNWSSREDHFYQVHE